MEENPSQILTLRLQRRRYSAEQIETYIDYRGNRLNLTPQQVDEVISKLPLMWNSEKDRLVYFVYFDDKTFTCQRKKDVFNYNTKDVEEKSYFFNAATQEQLDDLLSILVEIFNNYKVVEINQFYDEVMEAVQDTSIIKQNLLEMRRSELSSSDYMFNSDYQFKDEAEREKWTRYRQEWRDITESQFWTENDFSNIQLPISPTPKEQFFVLRSALARALDLKDELLPEKYTEELQEYVSNSGFEKLIKNFSQISLKLTVLQSLADLKIPIGFDSQDLKKIESSLPTAMFDDLEDDIDDETTPSITERYFSRIENKIDAINKEFEKYNLNYNIKDIIQSMYDKINEKAQEYESNKEVTELLTDIMFNGGEEL
jgi:hypothetical protein